MLLAMYGLLSRWLQVRSWHKAATGCALTGLTANGRPICAQLARAARLLAAVAGAPLLSPDARSAAASTMQVKAVPPVPALRLVVVSNLFAEAFMVCFHLVPKLLLAWVQRQRQRRRQADNCRSLPVVAASAEQPAGEKPPAKQPVDSCCTSEDGTSSGSPHEGPTEPQQDGRACPAAAAEAGQGSVATPGISGNGTASGKRRLVAAPSTLRPPVPLLRGLSRKMEQWEEERPVLRRRLALAAITVTFMGCCSLQILAPGFVDVSIGERSFLTCRCMLGLAGMECCRSRRQPALGAAIETQTRGAAAAVTNSQQV